MSNHNVAPKKAFGQNFLTDQHYLNRIASAVRPDKGQTVVEIGAGTGALTKALLERGALVVCIEKDERCLPVLEELSNSFPNSLTIVDGDALEQDFTTLAPKGSILAGNLPYNIGTQVVLNGLASADYFTRHVYLLQKEVVQRICATPEDASNWGRLAIACQMRGDCRNLFDVPPGAFFPAPKVTSAVVELTPLEGLRFPCDMKKVERITQVAFGQRRKMLRASLKSLMTTEQMASAGIDSSHRPETLSLKDFAALAELI